jgi:hypothetical protein
MPKFVVRTVHSLASTGATLLARCLATLPTVMFLNEVSPNGTHFNRFNAFDPLEQALARYRPGFALNNEVRRRLFMDRLTPIIEHCIHAGLDLVIRDHSHSDFMESSEAQASLLLGFQEHRPDFEIRDIALVRYPLASYITAKLSGFVDRIATYEEYCRRYLEFVAAYHNARFIRYEDFTKAGEQILRTVCLTFDLKYDPCMLRDFWMIQLSGNSGRHSADRAIHPVLMRPIDPAVRQIALASPSHGRLCAALKYHRDPFEYAFARARDVIDYDPNNSEAARALVLYEPI